jgi:hypothetical protein
LIQGVSDKVLIQQLKDLEAERPGISRAPGNLSIQGNCARRLHADC